MHPVARILVIAGIALVALGLAAHFLAGRGVPLGRLPGDIVVERGNFRLYFPITTAILASVVLSLLLRVFR